MEGLLLVVLAPAVEVAREPAEADLCPMGVGRRGVCGLDLDSLNLAGGQLMSSDDTLSLSWS